MKYHLVHRYVFWQIVTNIRLSHCLTGGRVTQEAITWKLWNVSIGRYTFLEWKRDMEAFYHIKFLPKNTNFNKTQKSWIWRLIFQQILGYLKLVYAMLRQESSDSFFLLHFSKLGPYFGEKYIYFLKMSIFNINLGKIITLFFHFKDGKTVARLSEHGVYQF